MNQRDCYVDERRFQMIYEWLLVQANDEVISDRQSRQVYDDLMDRIMKQA